MAWKRLHGVDLGNDIVQPPYSTNYDGIPTSNPNTLRMNIVRTLALYYFSYLTRFPYKKPSERRETKSLENMADSGICR